MNPRLQHAAESGSIDELYALIDTNPCILENIDAEPFINTPLHVAAAAGKLAFAMEMLNLKPSFARKLNKNGYSPLHLAVDKDQRDFVSWMLKHDHSLACVKERNGMTPLHLLVVRGYVDLVAECLLVSPECIEDVSVNGQNALHLAVVYDRLEVLQVLTGWIQRMSQRNALTIEIRFLNKEDFSYNTALNLAAYKNDLRAVRVLLECVYVGRNKVNGVGSTFLDILRNHTGVRDLDLERVVLRTRCKEAASVLKPKAVSDLYKSPIDFATHSSNDPHSLKMKHAFLLILWVFNTLGFHCALFNIFRLLPRKPHFTAWFFIIGTSLGVSYALAGGANSPNPVKSFGLSFVIFAFYFICVSLLDVAGWRKRQVAASEPPLSWF